MLTKQNGVVDYYYATQFKHRMYQRDLLHLIDSHGTWLKRLFASYADAPSSGKGSGLREESYLKCLSSCGVLPSFMSTAECLQMFHWLSITNDAVMYFNQFQTALLSIGLYLWEKRHHPSMRKKSFYTELQTNTTVRKTCAWLLSSIQVAYRSGPKLR